MWRVVGTVDVIFGAIFIALALLALLGAPSEFSDRVREPEDCKRFIEHVIDVAHGL